MEKLLLRPAEVAEALGLGRTMTYELLRSGAIATVRVGRVIRVPATAVREWIAKEAGRTGKRRQHPTAPRP